MWGRTYNPLVATPDFEKMPVSLPLVKFNHSVGKRGIERIYQFSGLLA